MLESKVCQNLFQQTTITVTRSSLEQNNLNWRVRIKFCVGIYLAILDLVCRTAVPVAPQFSTTTPSVSQWRRSRTQQVEGRHQHEDDKAEEYPGPNQSDHHHRTSLEQWKLSSDSWFAGSQLCCVWLCLLALSRQRSHIKYQQYWTKCVVTAFRLDLMEDSWVLVIFTCSVSTGLQLSNSVSGLAGSCYSPLL